MTESLVDWSIEALKSSSLVPAKHHRYLIRGLERVAAGQCSRLLVLMPPGSAKSTYVSKLFPAWMLQRKLGIKIVGVTHSSLLALDFSSMIQELVRYNEETLGYGLRDVECGQMHYWSTTNGGSYLAVDVRGIIPRHYHADLVVIDDPVKSRQEADSEVDRKRVWDWYTSLDDRVSVVLTVNRWHEDDLAGRILKFQADRWEVISIPAEAEDGDLLGRAPGEWLWSDDSYGYGANLTHIKSCLEAAGATREWASQYQQHPRSEEAERVLDEKFLKMTRLSSRRRVEAGVFVEPS